MKINLFTDSLGAGGAQRQLVGLAVLLKEKGFKVKVSSYYNIDFYKSFLDEKGVCNELIPGADNTKKRILAVRKYFRKEHPDWVIAYQETPSLVACAARLLGCKYKLIVSERNTTQVSNLNSRVRFMLYHIADAIVPNSYAQENYLLAHHPWMKSKLKTITNFVDLNRFSFAEHKRREVPEIITPASLMNSKNTLGYIEACALLKRQGGQFHVSWYGITDQHSEYYKQCLGKIKEYGLADCFSILEKTKQIDLKYREADYLCLPSFYEGTPNVICEAISTGLPVMCSDICDNPIYVEEGRNGVLFNPEDPQNMASKMKELLLQSDEEYQNYRHCSRSKAEELLKESTFLNKYLAIINPR